MLNHFNSVVEVDTLYRGIPHVLILKHNSNLLMMVLLENMVCPLSHGLSGRINSMFIINDARKWIFPLEYSVT